MSKKKIVLGIAVTAVISSILTVIGLAALLGLNGTRAVDMARFIGVKRLIETRYVNAVDSEQLVDGAINGMVQSLSRELAPMGIRVNAVAPGVTKTDMVANLPEEVIKPIIATIPLGRMGEPEDVANAFVFLASDMSSYVTGAVLPVDGAARS